MKALICGTAGIQINVPIDSFPFEYQSIVFKDDLVSMDVAGVGYSHSLCLGTLGDDVTFLTGVSNDMFADVITKAIESTNAKIVKEVKNKESLVSIVLYDDTGRRSIIREGRSDYKYKMDPKVYQNIDVDYDVALFSMAGFSRDLLKVVKDKNIPIVSDMQDVGNLTNEYGKEFLEYSDIVFFSDDNVSGDIKDVVKDLCSRYKHKIIGVGLGEKGCLLSVDGVIKLYPSIKTEVVNTVGAGDALFSCFIHEYFNGNDIETSIMKAQVFAANKIRYKTASEGFVEQNTLDELYSKYVGSDLCE